jgi:hypothetical protein
MPSEKVASGQAEVLKLYPKPGGELKGSDRAVQIYPIAQAKEHRQRIEPVTPMAKGV